MKSSREITVEDLEDLFDDDITEIDEIVEHGKKWMIPTSIGQQIFANATAVAGGLASMVLASKMSNVRRISGNEIALAAALSALATFGAIFVIYEME